MKNNFSRFVMLFMVIVMVASAFAFVAPTQNVYAGTNGQQISLMACNAVRVVIQGKNQSGTPVSYTLNKNANDCGYINISGWWWKGSVTATAYYNVSAEYPYYNGQTASATVPTNSSSNFYNVAVSTPSTRQWIAWRAQTWINDRLGYSQSTSSKRDGYRRDCSGFVSFVWQLSNYDGGVSTYTMLNNAYKISFDSLQPGDAVLNSGSHVVLFMGWVNQGAGQFTAYEENGSYGAQSWTLTVNKSTGVVHNNAHNYNYPGTYIAIRKNGL